ncbi:TetR/AcrR family transcriptional regulator [Streptomyces smyrnaeus]|uniref:TetR/AcrR family transcriptional regulator n=1 Tax=Streptomyces smyrnaeus TaxID=1387713 RepID=A0ABS3XVA0_9ACTN|nr:MULTISPECIES: TetR/AcrR family transcriptional regulator [Streptomyces]MBO8198996.1 TetR/AcrR family transcriptional regulator [Streptomyces smyrnaeus]MBQ1124654.1 TetR/AcrR family transcriptional regulator [Streptomyces sp. B15]
MPAARETLLDAAHVAVRSRPWSVVRMVDVAAAAGVSRQTLYNEFGSKEGLGAALVERVLEDFLDGAARAAAEACRSGHAPAGCCAAAAQWVLRTARTEPIVGAALTGCLETRMPLPTRTAPGKLAAALHGRVVSGLEEARRVPVGGPLREGFDRGEVERAYEVGLRVALSYVVAPLQGPGDEEPCGRVDEVVRALLAHQA